MEAIPSAPTFLSLLNENLRMIQSHIHGTPDLICEVLSPSTRERDLSEKAGRYLKCGVKEYWILDPKGPEILLWINRGGKWEKNKGDTISSEMLSGFKVIRQTLE